MPSHRRRSYSRERSESPRQARSRSRSRSPERRVSLPDGVSEISESDYFLKSDEFRVWLKEEKGKYFDELSSDKARKYFRKFVKAWNRGKLSKSLYAGVDKQSASSQTAYKWSFASKASRADNDALRAVRDEIDSATYNRPHHSEAPTRPGPSSGRVIGPAMPSASDRVLAKEAAEEYRAADRDYQRKREKKEAKERLEDVVGPKELGRAGMLEKKKVQREADRAFREKGDDGFEVDDSTLMGGGDSFQAQVARRESARKRFEDKREEKMYAARERADAIRAKDRATMDMFMQMAKEKFG
ncbi:hypothetical protein L226DRAFT_528911 [Lentinus tigrinus ALCF2SS1-7]|uniref:Splicing arginine serine-rich 12 n=1 Tax=Lentinus tigrinus ALCF2SS1-6 TaxID=1328759 RepID=A0A5C2SLQ1_9APHY|nr:hypothetical protein L227DRAFT_571173 [Lentinus tigrinus ALCF2SS1-6]RPD82785.1 hypothetical protein L226DRAFT_528911 [Lentinus tigrinus ALCF2SS1-7]